MIGRALLALALLGAAAPASADYVFDPADLPEGFECDDALNAEECSGVERYMGWSEKYGERVSYWWLSLLFDVESFFSEAVSPLPEPTEATALQQLKDRLSYDTPNLVDAVYSAALNPTNGWAFAIDQDARFRIVRPKTEEEFDRSLAERYLKRLPITLAETAEFIPMSWKFEEADLRTCDGAIAHLLSFPSQRSSTFWDESELEWAPGFKKKREKQNRFGILDGDGVFVRAREVLDRGSTNMSLEPGFVVYDQYNGGDGYDWAIEMERIARPCLRPTEATPPWQMYADAEASGG